MPAFHTSILSHSSRPASNSERAKNGTPREILERVRASLNARLSSEPTPLQARTDTLEATARVVV